MSNIRSWFRRFVARSICAIAVTAGGLSTALAYDGTGTPLIAEIGVPVRIDPTDGFRPEPAQQLRAEWAWASVPSGSTVGFDDPDAYRPSFTPDLAGSYVALATFYDIADTGSTTPKHTVRVEIGTGNLTPIAKIRLRGMPNGSSPVVVDATGSFDVNGDKLTYSLDDGKRTGRKLRLCRTRCAYYEFAPGMEWHLCDRSSGRG